MCIRDRKNYWITAVPATFMSAVSSTYLSLIHIWHTNTNRRIHVYERCSQFSILQNLPTAYMWSSPMPQRALEQYHLARCV